MHKIFRVFFLFTSLVYAQIKFDADFESGNLQSVSTTDSINYTLTTVPDIGGRWFYFKITGVKNRFIKVNISNSDVNRAMYSYDDENFIRFTEEESPQRNIFQKTFQLDTVFVAYYTPYSFSHLQQRLNYWLANPLATLDTLGLTDHGLPIQEMVITDPFTPDSIKKHIWIHARTHPGETPSSFQLEGIIEKLLSDDDVIGFYRQNLIFHIIPFTNPEGVFFGRSRTNFFGVDVEANWDKSETETSTEVKILKQRMLEINSKKILSVFLNLHSQVSSFATFWIHVPSSTSEYFYRREFQFANLQTSDNKYFSQTDYSFSTLKSKFPEGWLWNNYGDEVMALTYETPYDQYSSGDWVTEENLKQIGWRTVYAIAEYTELSHPKYVLLDNKNASVLGAWNVGNTGLEFYSDNFYTAQPGNGESKIIYTTDVLEPGNYDIYGWWPSDPSFAANTTFRINAGNDNPVIQKTQQTNGAQWNYLTNVNLISASQINISIDNNALGIVAADAFRIIYRGRVTSVENKNIQPADFVLYPNFPNPFNPSTTIRFTLKERQKVSLRIFDPLGKLITVLLDEELGSGTHQVIFDAGKFNLSSGVYYFSLSTPFKTEAKGMILLK